MHTLQTINFTPRCIPIFISWSSLTDITGSISLSSSFFPWTRIWFLELWQPFYYCERITKRISKCWSWHYWIIEKTNVSSHQPLTSSYTRKVYLYLYNPGFLNFGTIAILIYWIYFIILCVGTVLCIVGCLPASLAFTHWMQVTIKNVSRHCQMSPGEKNHPWLRTTHVIHCEMDLLLFEDKNIPEQYVKQNLLGW